MVYGAPAGLIMRRETRLEDLVDGFQVQKVMTASQSKSSTVWI